MSIAFCSGQYSNIIIVLCRGLGKGLTSPFKRVFWEKGFFTRYSTDPIISTGVKSTKSLILMYKNSYTKQLGITPP